MFLFFLFNLALSISDLYCCSLLLPTNLVSGSIHLPFLYFCPEHTLERSQIVTNTMSIWPVFNLASG